MVRGVLADGVEELRAVVLEGVADLADDVFVVPRLPAAIDILHDSAPLLEVPVDHSVYELLQPPIDELLGVRHDLLLETLLHLLLADELADVHDPNILL